MKFVMIILFSQILFSQIEADAYINFLQSTDVKNNKHFETIYNRELNAYLNFFPKAERNREVLKYLGDYYYAEGDYHIALFYYLKVRFLYSTYEQQMLNEQITRIASSHEKSDYKPVADKLLLSLNKLESTSLLDDQFKFISMVFDLDQEDLNMLLIEEAKRFITLFPQSINTDRSLIFIAKTYERMDNPEVAMFYYRLMLNLVPTSDQTSFVRFQIGRMLSEKFYEYRPAIDVYETLIQQDANYEFSHIAQFHIGRLYQDELSENNLAIEAYELYLKQYPSESYAVQSLERIATIYEDNNEFDNAIASLHRITEQYKIHPAATETQLRIVEILEDELKRYADAAKELMRFADIFPEHSDADEHYYDGIEMVADYVKDRAQVTELCTTFLERFPNSSRRDDVQDLLEEK
jgi:tetratricopeptide (TPR) repeat protein